MAVRLMMLVTRGEDNRLSGSVRLADGGDAREFSGTLELMRLFEDFVPAAIGGDELDAGRRSEYRSGSPPEG